MMVAPTEWTPSRVPPDRIRACLLAGAVGDAFASASEGTLPATRARPPTWSVTDDTMLTLATCRAVGAWSRRTSDPLAAHVARELLSDYRAGGLVGLGSSTFGALRSLDMGAHWALSGLDGEYAAGNGAAMRMAPLAFVVDASDPLDRVTIRDVVRITHRHQEALAGALAMLSALQIVAREPVLPRGELLQRVADVLFDSNVRDNIRALLDRDALVYAEALSLLEPTGYVAHSVPLALVAARHHAHVALEQCLDDVVEGGGDTDTIASMAGQLIGLARGPNAELERLFEQVRDRERIVCEVDAFCAHVTAWTATAEPAPSRRRSSLLHRLRRWWAGMVTR
ncbi:MAG: ADP-ribosylglycohydrolase family protein [Myxococcales bacterium]|nr:ADP-ribosylglycohydrolase family protein [Myxococcales bacterium]